MAYEPGTGRECLFVNRGVKIPIKPFDGPAVSPLRGGRVGTDELQLVLPTAEMSGEPGPEQGDT